MICIRFGRFLLALLVGLVLTLTACKSEPTSADKEFIQGVDVMEKITAADCKELKKLEDRFLLKVDAPTANEATDAATYLPVIHDRQAALHCDQ